MSRASGKPIAFRNETVEEAYASRAHYGAPDWEVEGWVTSYQSIAAGEAELVTGEVERLAGHPPASLADFLGAYPHALDHVTDT
jgi:NAD(P)H dehydrogenase (quinone)